MKKLGLVSISFRDKTPKEILIAMKNAGLSYIEWGSDVHAPKDDIEKINEIIKLQEEYGIECCSYGTYFRLGETPLEELEGYIKTAKLLGTNILRLWCGVKNRHNLTAEEKEKLFSDCKKAAEIAEKRKAVLCLECHNNTYTEDLNGALEIIEYVNSPFFCMYWQPNQFREFNENMEYAEKIAPYTKHIHVFKWRGQKKFSLYDGIEEWKSFLKFFGDYSNLLLEFMPDNNIESLKREADALREIVGVIE